MKRCVVATPATVTGDSEHLEHANGAGFGEANAASSSRGRKRPAKNLAPTSPGGSPASFHSKDSPGEGSGYDGVRRGGEDGKRRDEQQDELSTMAGEAGAGDAEAILADGGERERAKPAARGASVDPCRRGEDRGHHTGEEPAGARSSPAGRSSGGNPRGEDFCRAALTLVKGRRIKER